MAREFGLMVVERSCLYSTDARFMSVLTEGGTIHDNFKQTTQQFKGLACHLHRAKRIRSSMQTVVLLCSESIYFGNSNKSVPWKTLLFGFTNHKNGKTLDLSSHFFDQ